MPDDRSPLDKALNGPPGDTGRVEPKQSAIQKLFARWLESRGDRLSSLPYPLYAIARFGFLDAMRRTWEYHLHPRNGWDLIRARYRRYKRVDRRPKKSWTLTVYAINRDGDYGIVECPQCHRTQHLLFNLDLDQSWEQRNSGTPKVFTQSVPPKTFMCSGCSIGFRVHLEDGIRKIRDHRDGVPPFPATMVEDDNHKWHLGISADAPWWWNRRELYRDYNPKNGKDGHGHKPYEIFPVKPDDSMCGNCQSEQPQLPQTGAKS